MQRSPRSQRIEVSDTAAGLSPFQLHLVRRLEHLLAHAVPEAREPWQIELTAHAIRHVLTECNQAGLGALATARLREAGRRMTLPPGETDFPEASQSAGFSSN